MAPQPNRDDLPWRPATPAEQERIANVVGVNITTGAGGAQYAEVISRADRARPVNGGGLAAAVHAVQRASDQLPPGHDALSWLRVAERLVQEALDHVNTEQPELMHVDNGLLVTCRVQRALCGADVTDEPDVPPETPVTCPGCARRCGLTVGQAFTRMSRMSYDISAVSQVLHGLFRRPGPSRWTPRPRSPERK
jgi:hypothetical protein